MKPIRLPGVLGYVTMAMWLLQVILSPVRASDSITNGAFSPSIIESLILNGAPESISVDLATPDMPAPANSDEDWQVRSVKYDAVSGRFLIQFGTEFGESKFEIAGTAFETHQQPILLHSKARGEIITVEDIEWVEKKGAPRSTMLTSAGDIIGKVTRRPLRKSVPIRKIDVKAPILIKRGDIVTMLVESPGLRLTQSGVAQSNGAQGEIVEIKNISSERLIKSVVIGRNIARVPMPLTANANYAANTLQ